MWLLLIKCSLYHFYNIVFISSMFTWPNTQSGYYAINKIEEDRSANSFTMCILRVIYFQLR